eukprot:COSAG01_NODE_4392_length_5071_cov_14.381738_2_plen_154_part_00
MLREWSCKPALEGVAWDALEDEDMLEVLDCLAEVGVELDEEEVERRWGQLVEEGASAAAAAAAAAATTASNPFMKKVGQGGTAGQAVGQAAAAADVESLMAQAQVDLVRSAPVARLSALIDTPMEEWSSDMTADWCCRILKVELAVRPSLSFV